MLSLNPLAFGLSYNLGRREREKLEGWKKKDENVSLIHL